jgi:cyclophilin family peptidyl-prolyl cis-trans isomerase
VATEKRERQRQARQERKELEEKKSKRRSQIRRMVIVVVVAAVVVVSFYLIKGGNSSKSASGSSTSTTIAGTLTAPQIATAQSQANKVSEAAGCPSSPSARANSLSWSTAPAMAINPAKTYVATITTDLGPFVVTLDATKAPITVNNFVFLAQHNYYHCVIFHRVIPNFMDQTGDPTGTGTGGPGYTITDENPAKAPNAAQQYPIGSVAMANTGQPNSGGSQFFIVAGPEGESLPNSYALFGQVTSGMNIVQKINQQGSTANNGVPPQVTHRILSVKIAVQ